MTLRKWNYLFWTTLLIGTVVAFAAGLVVVAVFEDFAFWNIEEAGANWATFVFIILGGATISVLSQMGMFAYMILRYVAAGFFRSKSLWDIVQIFLVVIVAVDFVYLTYANFAEEGETFWSFVPIPLILLVIAAAVAWWKKKLTNAGAFIPTLFFMYVATVLEAIPALRLDSLPSTIFMLVPLVACNAWQILILHKLLPGAEKEKVS